MFSRISVPVPFQVGRVNTYVAGRTVVDPGPDSDTAWETVTEGLAENGLDPEEIERVLITHPHPDHFGLAGRFRKLGASVCAGPDAAQIIDDFSNRLAQEQAFFRPFLERCGIPPETVESIVTLPESFLEFAPPVETDQLLEDGDTMTVDGTTVTVSAVDGHAAGERIFSFETDTQRRAVVGDHVLGSITPNPFLRPPDTVDQKRPRVLPRYNDSLDRLRENSFDQLLPGHGSVIQSPTTRIAEIREAHETRTENVHSLIDGPTTPAEVMHGLFDDLPATEMFGAISEAVGHLDVLEARGEVVCQQDGELFQYELCE